MEKPTEAMMEKGTPEAVGMAETPEWFAAQFEDARTGMPFSVAGFKGKVVLVETMAIWCSTCKRQQGEVVKLHEMLGERDDFVSVGLDIDINEQLTDLKVMSKRTVSTGTTRLPHRRSPARSGSSTGRSF